ncbi:hypothetical protein N7510_002286 [Penicillium lagena]|uniref:uncharacterized protein n=1 Tax=Penicillium lagena TaxID=94218 RepID=UPI00253FF7A6|nr:uncharacterized protein N7510_002286 [Penicillium lagena]KAJ5625977.1 hypothetical protein N7510_002286 [Penicillium lagena]
MQVKCDETQPSCKRCLARRIHCSGYDAFRWRWSKKHEQFRSNFVEDEASTRKCALSIANGQGPSPFILEDGEHPESTIGLAFENSENLLWKDQVISNIHDNLSDKLCQEHQQLLISSPPPYTLHDTGCTWWETPPEIPCDGDKISTLTLSIKEEDEQRYPFSLSSSLLDPHSELVQRYFSHVSPTVSTFDSPSNPFRSVVAQGWQSSLSMLLTMKSMTGATLARFSDEMRIIGLQNQRLAYGQISREISHSPGAITDVLLFCILLLGISSVWHDPKDYGTVHLKAVRDIIRTRGFTCTSPYLTETFFKKALVYWEMVSCVVDNDFSTDEASAMLSCLSDSVPSFTSSCSRVVPHPWTGIGAEPQLHFTCTAKLIRQLRSMQNDALNIPAADINRLLVTAEKIEADAWMTTLPNLREIDAVGDPDTPSSHHLFIAEGYLLATLFQLYLVFPDMAKTRQRLLNERIFLDDHRPRVVYSTGVWSLFKNCSDDPAELVRCLGHSIVVRLEQIPVSSKTTCLQLLLMLVAAGSLGIRDEEPNSDNNQWILQARQFILDRIDYFRHIFPIKQVDAISLVIENIIDEVQTGRTVFWMDTMTRLNAETVLG